MSDAVARIHSGLRARRSVDGAVPLQAPALPNGTNSAQSGYHNGAGSGASLELK